MNVVLIDTSQQRLAELERVLRDLSTPTAARREGQVLKSAAWARRHFHDSSSGRKMESRL